MVLKSLPVCWDFLGGMRARYDAAGLCKKTQLLASIDGIDAGEAVLFSATAEFDQYLLSDRR